MIFDGRWRMPRRCPGDLQMSSVVLVSDLSFLKSSKSRLGMAIALREFEGADHTHSRLHAATPQMKINENGR